MKRDNLVGEKFGRLTVKSSAGSDICGHSMWLCECECGNQVVIAGTNLKRGLTGSCGCRRIEIATERLTTHGMYGTPLYICWSDMLQRCRDPNNKLYHRYGGRGIVVCDEWKSFENFNRWAMDSGYMAGLTIDRINNDKGYYPENCRWVDRITQGNNTSKNRRVSYHSMNKTVAEWARLLEMDYNILYRHLAKNNVSDLERYFEKDDKNNKNN